MTLLLLLLLIVLLLGGGGLGAWQAPAYRGEWIGIVAVIVVLVLLFYLFAPTVLHAPPVIVR